MPFINGYIKECQAPSSFPSHLRTRAELRVDSRIDSELIRSQLWHYSLSPFGGHNFHTGALIDTPFAATRSSLHPLCIYASYERLVEAKEGVEEVLPSLRMPLGVMGMTGRNWMLKWSRRTVHACVELGIQRTLSRRKAIKERLCREISAHNDHMETPNCEKLSKALGHNVASSG
ncbi:hypothetical protein PIB30_075106, partial [Stylosanthes scabra]|nr:hypothetical protein [Stylosanthes scabra]